jgi:hypothetical protein
VLNILNLLIAIEIEREFYASWIGNYEKLPEDGPSAADAGHVYPDSAAGGEWCGVYCSYSASGRRGVHADDG